MEALTERMTYVPSLCFWSMLTEMGLIIRCQMGVKLALIFIMQSLWYDCHVIHRYFINIWQLY